MSNVSLVRLIYLSNECCGIIPRSQELVHICCAWCLLMTKPTCANCGIVLRWQPTVVGQKVYCCPGCAEGGPCECDYDNLPQPGDVKALVLKRTYVLKVR